MFLPWRWYKGFYVGKQACHAKLNCLYRTLSFTRALIRGICTSGSDCPLSLSRWSYAGSCVVFFLPHDAWWDCMSLSWGFFHFGNKWHSDIDDICLHLFPCLKEWLGEKIKLAQFTLLTRDIALHQLHPFFSWHG